MQSIDLGNFDVAPPDLTDGVSSRKRAHKKFKSLIKMASDKEIAEYAIGDINWDANYSAQERRQHGFKLSRAVKWDVDWKIKVADLTKELNITPRGKLLETLRQHPIKFLKVSIASEIAMVLHPDTHCLINKRTVFGMYLIKFKKMKKADSLISALKDSQFIMQSIEDVKLSDLIDSINKHYAVWEQMAYEVQGVLEQFYYDTLKKTYNDDDNRFFIADRYCSHMYDEAKEAIKS